MAPYTAYHRVCNKSNTIDAMCGAGTVTLPQLLSAPPVLYGVLVTRSVVLCDCFVNRCLSFCPFSFDHCVVCHSLI